MKTMIGSVVAALLAASSFLAIAPAEGIEEGSYDYEVTITDLRVKDVKGLEVAECSDCASSMLMLTTAMKNHLSSSKPFVVYLEVRDLTTEYTVYNEFATGTLSPNGITEVGILWKPGQAGNYELRSFVFDNLQNTERMSGIETTTITVVSGQRT